MKLLQLMALTLIILMISMPFTIATEIIDEEQLQEKSEIGEDIVINVDEYQPKVLRSSLIEEQNVNIYALLKGIPSNPTLSIGNIRGINVRATKVLTEPEGKDVKIGSIKYVRPGVKNNAVKDLFYNTFAGQRTPASTEFNTIKTRGLGYQQELDYDNLGYIVIPIQRIEREDDVPEKITVQIEGSIEFDASSGLNFGPSTDILPEQTETEWNAEKDLHRFYGGYLRVENIDSGRNRLTNPGVDTSISLRGTTYYQGNTYGFPSYYRGDQYADIVLYDLNGQRINLGSYLADTSASKAIDSTTGVRAGALRLRVGETSKTYKTPTTGQSSSLFNQFQVRLDEVRSQRPNIVAYVQIGDELPTRAKIGEGTRISPQSTWKLYRIRERTTDQGRVFELIFRNDRGQESAPLLVKEERKDTSTTSGTAQVTTTPSPQDCNGLKINTPFTGSIDLLFDSAKRSLADNQCEEDAIILLKQLREEYLKRAQDKSTNPTQLADLQNSPEFQKVQEIDNILASYQQKPDDTTLPQGTVQQGSLRNAILEYKTFISEYESLTEQEQKSDELQQKYANSFLQLGLIYWEIGDELSASNAFRQYLDLPTNVNDQNTRSAVEDLIIALDNSLRFSNNIITLPEPGNLATKVTIISSPLDLQDDSGKATIRINNGNPIVVAKGDQIPLTGFEGYDPGQYDWRIIGIESDRIVVECATDYCSKDPATGNKLRQYPTEVINLGTLTTSYTGHLTIGRTNDGAVKRVDVVLVEAPNVPLEAVVSIIPVSEKAYSSVNFNVNIPVEKRPFELPLFSGSLDKEINNTQQLIVKLDKVIDKVGKLHEFWSKLCLSTFAVLWAKNLLSVNQGAARREINPYWKEKWQKERKPGETFDSYLIRNQDLYEKDSEKTQQILDQIDNGDHIKAAKAELTARGMKDINDKDLEGSDAFLRDWYLAKEKAKDYPELYLQKFVSQDIELQLVQRNKQVETFSESNEVPGDIQKFYSGNGEQITKAYWATNKDELIRGWADAQKTEIIGTYLLGDQYDPEKGITTKGQTFDTRIKAIFEETGAEQNPDNTREINNALGGLAVLLPVTAVGSDELPRASVRFKDGSYSYFDGQKYHQLYQDPNNNPPTDKSKATPVTSLEPHLTKPKGGTQRPVYYYEKDTDTTPKVAIVVDKYSTAKHKPIVTQYESGNRCEGLTKQLSADAYNYLEVEYSSGCRIDKVKVCKRTDANGQPGTKSDRCTGEVNDVINTLKNSKDPEDVALAKTLAQADSCIVQSNRFFEKSPYKDLSKNNLVGINNPLLAKGFKCGTENYHVDKSAPPEAGPSCSDFMDPTDCRILFNACDPVICPASRCNLGGNWQVDNVVQSGIVGSVALCSLNFPEVAVPVCITGIRAGLQNIKSVLEGYEQCLVTQKNEGKSVGICDRVRNIYVCEILWKEGVAIFNVKGGLLSYAAEKLFGATSGGGEYSDFSAQFDQSIQGIQYFTQSYAKNVFAAYDGGSIDEIGTEICKSAIFGKAPGVGNFFDEIQKPESPPQFFAFFDEAPYTDLTQVPQSIYSVYYHIYAGDNEDVRYSVFLRGIDDNNNIVTNFKFLDNNKALAKGKMVDINKDITAISGYNEICVSILTQRYGRIEQCGFGKVSTDFALNYLNEQYAKSQAQQQIKNAEECEAQNSRLTSLSYGSEGISGGVNPARAGVGSVSTGLVQTGIVRKCFGINPNTNGLPDQWTQVGTCGQDEQGRDLGACWLYKPALNKVFQQQSSLADVEKSLKNLTTDLDQQGILESPYSSPDEIKAAFNEAQGYRTKAKETCDKTQYDAARQKYNEISDSSIEATDSAKARYEIAETWKEQYYCERGANSQAGINNAPTGTENPTVDTPTSTPSTPTTSPQQNNCNSLTVQEYQQACTYCTQTYQELINDQAAIYAMDPQLLTALIVRESLCNPNALGSDGKSLGLTQITAGAITDVITQGKEPNTFCKSKGAILPAIVDPTNAKDNIAVGACYFAYMLQKSFITAGTEETIIKRALNGYNGGLSTINNAPTAYANSVYDIYQKIKKGTAETTPSSTPSATSSSPVKLTAITTDTKSTLVITNTAPAILPIIHNTKEYDLLISPRTGIEPRLDYAFTLSGNSLTLNTTPRPVDLDGDSINDITLAFTSSSTTLVVEEIPTSKIEIKAYTAGATRGAYTPIPSSTTSVKKQIIYIEVTGEGTACSDTSRKLTLKNTAITPPATLVNPLPLVWRPQSLYGDSSSDCYYAYQYDFTKGPQTQMTFTMTVDSTPPVEREIEITQ